MSYAIAMGKVTKR